MNDYDKSKGQKGLRRGCLIHGRSLLSQCGLVTIILRDGNHYDEW
jgi:hypothetical protein